MKKTFSFYIVLGLMAFVSFIFANNVTNQDSFWTEAAQDGRAEVIFSELALERSQNNEVKSLAQMIIDNHTKINEELKTLASRKNVTLPADINAKQKTTMGRLNELSDMAFDREFLKTLVKNHETAVILFQKQADVGTDADLRTFADNTLPILKAHLEMAETVSDKLNGNTNTMK